MLSDTIYSCSIGNSDRNLRSDRGNEYYYCETVTNCTAVTRTRKLRENSGSS
jgi:hypothetical protein